MSPTSSHACTLCSTIHSTTTALAAHKQDHHTLGSWPCIWCGTSFLLKIDLRRHSCSPAPVDTGTAYFRAPPKERASVEAAFGVMHQGVRVEAWMGLEGGVSPQSQPESSRKEEPQSEQQQQQQRQQRQQQQQEEEEEMLQYWMLQQQLLQQDSSVEFSYLSPGQFAPEYYWDGGSPLPEFGA